MALHPIDITIIILYLIITIQIGVFFRKRAMKRLDAYYLGERQVSWWMIGLSGCSSYTDIGGTMLIVGLMYYLGIKSVWILHIAWGFFTMAIFMSYQAKYIRRSGVMTAAEWNATRFGDTKDTEYVRVAVASFILLSMILTLVYVAVGTGKFAEEFVPLPRWASTSILFAVVGVYVTFGGFFGVVWTDIFQTTLIIIGAVGLSIAALQLPDGLPAIVARTPEWGSLAPTWSLWTDYLTRAPASLLVHWCSQVWFGFCSNSWRDLWAGTSHSFLRRKARGKLHSLPAHGLSVIQFAGFSPVRFWRSAFTMWEPPEPSTPNGSCPSS
jgi:SSS family solute:Na+ symporter